MTNIQPDTSLYSTMPDKLRAMALILERPQENIQTKIENAWLKSSSRSARLHNLTIALCEYRLKPAPRELWVLYDGTGIRRGIYDSRPGKEPPHFGWTFVRLVEAT